MVLEPTSTFDLDFGLAGSHTWLNRMEVGLQSVFYILDPTLPHVSCTRSAIRQDPQIAPLV